VGSGDSLASAPSELWRLAAVCATRGACQPIPNFQGLRTKRSVGTYFAVVGWASARIGLSLRINIEINISLTIGEIYKMIEDFST